MSLGNMCSKKYSKDNSEQFGNVPRKGNYILPKNIKYNQNNSLKRKSEIILIFKPPREVTMHPQLVSIARENAVTTQYQ